jgi:hypothetical protein
MNVLQEIRTSTGVFKLRSDGIIESCPNENFKGKFIIIEAKEFVGAMKELCEDGAKPLLAHMGDHEIT